MKKGLVLIILVFILSMSVINAQDPWPTFTGNLQHTGLSSYDTSNINGAVKWTFETGDGIESSPTIAEDGTIYFGSHDGYLYALNEDGVLKWKFKPAEPIYNQKWQRYSAIISSPTISEDGTVYIIAPNNYLYAVKDGAEKWRFPLKWNAIDFWASATIGLDGTIYVGSAMTSEGDNLIAGFYAINPDGSEKWHYKIDAGVTSAPAIATGGTIYVNGNLFKELGQTTIAEGYLFAFNSDGTLKWKFKVKDWIETSPSIGKDGTVYTGSKEGRVYAVNPDGSKKWEFAANDGIGGTPVIAEDGTIYVGSWDNNFYAINPDGSEKWEFEVDSGFESIGSSAAIGSDGIIYFGTSRGIFYALNPDGTEKWHISNMGSVASSPAIGKDNILYVGAWDKKLYAIGAGEASKPEDNPEDCHAKQLQREVKFDQKPGNTCIEGECDSYETICQRKALDGSCYASLEVCVSRNCKKYRSYCNLILKNTEVNTGFTAVFKQNYITADGQKHFIKEMRAFTLPGQERSIAWQYEVDANNLGSCDYSDLANPICEPENNTNNVTWTFTTERTDDFRAWEERKNDSKPFKNKSLILEQDKQAIDDKRPTEKVSKNLFSKLFSWILNLFGKSPNSLDRPSAGMNENDAPMADSKPNDKFGAVFGWQAGPGGCKSQAECDIFCSKPENTEKCPKSGSSDNVGDGREQINSDIHPNLENGELGGCKTRAECEAFCSKPENREKCSKFAPPDEMPLNNEPQQEI